MKGRTGIYLLAVALATCLTCGCAVSTTRVKTSATTPVPESRIVNTDYQTPEPGDAHIIIKRDAGFFASGCDFLVSVQGTSLAALRPAERIDLYLKPGDYILGASQGCGQTAVIEVEANVKADELKTYRLEMDGQLGEAATFRIMPTEND